MKRIMKFFAGLLVLLSNFTATGQEKSLLWQITGKGLAKPSYLFGTIHLVCRTDYFWTAAMKQSLERSDKLCLEMDMDNMEAMMKATTGLMDMSGKKLSEYFTPEQYSLVSKYVKDSLGMDIAMLEMMKPVALQVLMTTRSAFCEDAVSYEDSIMKSAQKSNKEVLGLESPEDQLAALESFPVDSIIQGLVETAQGNTGAEDKMEYRKMVDAYKNQDIGELQKMIVESGEFASSTGPLLDDRNKKWISTMSGMMNTSSVFFAVGAGHLAGDSGVISLLRKQGYKVEALK